MLEVRTLGGLSLRVNGRALKDMGSHKAEALLVYLAVKGGERSRSELLTLFWPESAEERASTSLRVALSILRRRLTAYLEVSRDAVGIKPGAKIALDVSELERDLESGRIEQALQVYQGDFLQGFHVRESSEFEDWLESEQERLRELVAGALHRWISRAIESGDCAKGRSLVNRLLELDSLDERAHYQSVLLHALAGERTAALAQYDKCREILHTELGVEPSEELEQLHERILKGAEPASMMPTKPENNLPAVQTSFIGREKELAKIGALIRDHACRLLTLVGPGGSGKTRLALQAAAEALRSFPDGSYFVPLEAGNSADYLVSAILRVLPFNIDSFINPEVPRIQLLNYLRKRSMLLVLDGCEQLSGKVGDLSAILENAPDVKVLATSRQRLGLQCERAFPVEGLGLPQASEDVPADGVEAVKLFRERTEQAGADFQLTEADYEPVVRICRMVDGMPLGIELAAAWTSVLSLPEIAEEAGKSLDFLTTSMGDMPERHRSIRAVFDSSWSLLTDELREMFARLSIFPGGFDRQAAQEVAGANLEQLSALLNRSLLRRTEAGHFTMHSLLRQYAAEKLSELGELEKDIQYRFCRYYVDMVTQREADLRGPMILQARDQIRLEMDNVRAAINWASVDWPEPAARKLLLSLMWFYAVQGWHEGADAFQEIARLRREALLARNVPDPANDSVVLSARIHQAFYLCNLGQIDESEAISRECLEGLRQPGLEIELSECLQNLGVNASYRGEYEGAKDLLEKAVLLGREFDQSVWPTYLLWLGYLYFLLGEYEQGLMSLQKCYDLFDRKGTLWGTAFALSKMGLAVDGLGEHARAKKYHEEALSVFDRLESQAGKAYALSRMSLSAYFLEQYPEAAHLGQEGYEMFKEIGHRWGICTSLCALGFANIGLGDMVQARVYFRNALQESKPDQIVPQSLYALIGLACVLANQGEKERALELLRFVRRHPETPSIYLDQAARWISDLEQLSLRSPEQEVWTAHVNETLDELVARLLS
jgi:predicted ATPase/DNA-binding SARP family transcriptional activator